MAMIEHHSAGAIVFIGKRVLVLRRRDRDEWVFPKGHLERGEQSRDAAVREVREETGLAVSLVRPLGSTEYTFRLGSHRHHKVVDWFLGVWVAGEVRLEPLFAEWRLDEPAQAGRLITHPEDRETLSRAVALMEEAAQ